MLNVFENTAREHGPISSFRVLQNRIYLVDDADLIQQLLVTRQHEFVRDTGASWNTSSSPSSAIAAEPGVAGYRIRRGESIFLSPYITQRNPRYFENPGVFQPERWDHIDIPKFAYFPFGGRAKMCIAEPFARLEGLLALATLGKNGLC